MAVTLVRRLAEPAGGFRVILGHAASLREDDPHQVLATGVALLGGSSAGGRRAIEVASLIGIEGFPDARLGTRNPQQNNQTCAQECPHARLPCRQANNTRTNGLKSSGFRVPEVGASGWPWRPDGACRSRRSARAARRSTSPG